MNYPLQFSVYFIILLFIFGCQPENSRHQIIEVVNENRDLNNFYIAYLQEQIESDPKTSDNYIKLADIYEKQLRKESAVKLLQKAARQTHEDTKVLLELGKLYLEDLEVDQLADILKTVRQKDPENIDFLKLSSGYALLRRDYTNAIFFANRAMLINPYDDENLFLLARAKLISKDSITALQNFEEAYQLKNSVKNFSGLFNLSLALGETSKARDFLIEFVNDHRDLNCCYYRGAYFNAVNQKDSARMILKNCDETPFSEGRINYELARTFSPVNTDSVFYYVNLFLENNPEDIPGLVLKARTLERINYYTDAKTLYQKAIKIDSTSRLATEALDNLERKVAYLRLIKRKENVQRELEMFKPLNSKEIN